MNIVKQYDKSENIVFRMLVAVVLIIVFLLIYNRSNLFTNEVDINKNLNKFIDSDMTLINFKFEGLNKSLNPYSISADSATKISDDYYKLNKVIIDYKILNNNLIIKSDNADLNNNNAINFLNNVKVIFGDLDFETPKLSINLDNNTASSENRVNINYNNCHISGNTFFSDINKEIVELHGKVKTKINIQNF